MVVYLDLVILLNFAVDYLLLLGTNRLSGFPPGFLRCALAAALGGIYSGLCMLPGASVLGSPLGRVVSLGLMGISAFGCNWAAGKRICVFLILAMALGGIALSIGRGHISGLLMCAGLQLLLCHLAFPEGLGKRFRSIRLTLGDNTVTAFALVDTGNTLTDPVTGEPVVVLSPKLAESLTGLTRAQLADPAATMAQPPVPGLRLMPFRTVGVQGLLLCLRIRDAEVDGRKQSLLVAFAPEGFGKGETYQALTGGAL